MREVVARAYVHRGRLGDQAAAEAALVLAAEVDNPEVLSVATGTPAHRQSSRGNRRHARSVVGP